MKPLGILLAIIVPCFFIMLLEVIKIAKAIDAEKKRKEESEKADKEAELAELRRKLAELEKNQTENSQKEGGSE
jgi:choline-glycine betaine transporter